MIAGVAAIDLDGGTDRQGGKLAKLRHRGIAIIAISQAAPLISRFQRSTCVARRHIDRRELASFFSVAEQFAVRSIDEVKLAASLADDRFIGALRIVRFRLVCQPMLHTHTGPGTFEDEIGHRGGQSAIHKSLPS
jgi:hypothetical protein